MSVPGGLGCGRGRLGLGLLVPHQVPTLLLSGQRKVTDGNKKHHLEPQGRILSPNVWRMSPFPDTQGLRAEAWVSGPGPCDFGEMGSGLSVPVSAWTRPGNPRSPVQLEEERAAGLSSVGRPEGGVSSFSDRTGTGCVHSEDWASPRIQRPPRG